jgi:EAL domain-containing protein (putative c-di-GMP-specific phosphodiesterase class I)
MGGDEFMVILERIGCRESAEKTAAELHRIVAEPMLINGLELSIEASIGISLYPTDGETAEHLKQNADHAMYKAKFEHVGTRSFSPIMEMETSALRELREELTRALQNDGFEINYQPQYKSDGCIVGFEALLRFRHSRLGTIPPSKFIPIAEEMGLIVPLGDWVLRNVCRQSVEWQRRGYEPLPIAVNISPLQFARTDFAEGVAEILAETGLDPALLELELTESLVMKDVFESARQLRYLNQIGISIAIDDFGTGYSSLSCLHQLPINVLKIDRSFIEKLTDEEGTRPIVESVISMAQTLGLRVVAEGVETLEQLKVLRQNNCDRMQGYFFAPALSPEEAVHLLMNRRCDSTEGSHSLETVSLI